MLLRARLSGVVSKHEALDADSNGKVSRNEFSALDSNADGKVSRLEAMDLNHNGDASHHEKLALDANHDGTVTRHEILLAPDADQNNDGKVTWQELKRVQLPLLQPSTVPTHHIREEWPCGLWNSYQEAFGELVLLLIFILPACQALIWLSKRLRRRQYATLRVHSSR